MNVIRGVNHVAQMREHMPALTEEHKAVMLVMLPMAEMQKLAYFYCACVVT